MSEEKDRKIIEAKGGIFNDLAARIKLIMRLMADARVHPLYKLLPVGSLVYLLFPDIVPGPVDDVAIIWLGSYLFVELCPQDVVKEHLDAINQVLPGQWREPEPEDDIIDADSWEPEE